MSASFDRKTFLPPKQEEYHAAVARYFRTSPDEDGTGKLADLIVLDRDPFQTDASALATIRVERTMVGGKWRYES